MKILDVLQPKQQLDEINLKQAIAAGLIGAATTFAPHAGAQVDAPLQKPSNVIQPQHLAPRGELDEPIKTALSQFITARYKADSDLADDIVDAAYKYQYSDFPKATDILATIGVESSFRPNVQEPMAIDPGTGLMQVRGHMWKIPTDELHDVEMNIKHGAAILHYYYKKFRHNRAAAIQAYNMGETKIRRGMKNPEYLTKVFNERKRLERGVKLALHKKKKPA